MPYLAQSRKEHINNGGEPVTEGDLTYVFTKIVLDGEDRYAVVEDVLRMLEIEATAYLENGRDNYGTRCQVIGAFTCAALEYRRRKDGPGAMLLHTAAEWWYAAKVAPYEDLKIQQNGDVYP